MGKIDILNRTEFVDQLIHLIENISNNKSATCFALDGPWGCGKSFVLDMLEEKLDVWQSEETYDNKYFIIRYNSWKYDYYEEPLVALVTSMISAIDQKMGFLSEKQKSEVLGVLKAAANLAGEAANTILKAKLGIDLLKWETMIQEGKEAGAKAYEAEHQYDNYTNFNKGLIQLKDTLHKLSKDFTIILLVDELDRCIPEYAIKVLERLHHLTDDISNIITVIATDKNRLATGINQIFGYDDPDKYLEKFINFTVSLDCGMVSSQITDKYSDYINLFDKDILPFPESIEECLGAIFKNIDMRTQEHIMHKVALVHNLLFSSQKDYSFMCMEILIAVMICVYKDKSCPVIKNQETPVLLHDFINVFKPYANSPIPAFLDFFTTQFKRIGLSSKKDHRTEIVYYQLPENANLYSAILLLWYIIRTPNKETNILAPCNGIYTFMLSESCDELKKFAETFRLLNGIRDKE